METLVKVLLYLCGGALIGAVLFCLVALLPFFDLDPQDAAYVGAGVGALGGLVFGLTRRFA